MKKLLLSLIFVLCSAVAANAAMGDIAVVNIQTVLDQSLANKDIKAQMKTKRDEYQAMIMKDEEELRKQDKELAKQRGIIDNELYEKKKEEFKNNLVKVQRANQAKLAKLDSAFNSAYDKLNKELYVVIKKIAEDRKLSLVLPTSQTLYNDGGLNITDEVIKGLNASVASVKVEIKN